MEEQVQDQLPVEVIIGTYEQYLIGYQLKVDQVCLVMKGTNQSLHCFRLHRYRFNKVLQTMPTRGLFDQWLHHLT